MIYGINIEKGEMVCFPMIQAEKTVIQKRVNHNGPFQKCNGILEILGTSLSWLKFIDQQEYSRCQIPWLGEKFKSLTIKIYRNTSSIDYAVYQDI